MFLFIFIFSFSFCQLQPTCSILPFDFEQVARRGIEICLKFFQALALSPDLVTLFNSKS